MIINRHNFDAQTPFILSQIGEADFVSIDCEFSGLLVNDTSHFDTMQERYAAYSLAASTFAIFQYGICCFKQLDDGSFSSCPFAFDLFNHVNKDLPNNLSQLKSVIPSSFVTSNSSLSFLVDNNFDFNNVFTNGLPFINHDQESVARKIIDTYVAQDQDVGELDDEAMLFLNNAMYS